MLIEETDKFLKITAEEGFFLTEFNEEVDDILHFSSCKIMFSPLNYDVTNIREITAEENDLYLKLQEEKINDIQNENGEI